MSAEFSRIRLIEYTESRIRVWGENNWCGGPTLLLPPPSHWQSERNILLIVTGERERERERGEQQVSEFWSNITEPPPAPVCCFCQRAPAIAGNGVLQDLKVWKLEQSRAAGYSIWNLRGLTGGIATYL